MCFQDEQLKEFVDLHGERWDIVATHFIGRTDLQCQHRWHKVVNPELVKGPWTKEVSPSTLNKLATKVIMTSFTIKAIMDFRNLPLF